MKDSSRIHVFALFIAMASLAALSLAPLAAASATSSPEPGPTTCPAEAES